MCSNGSYANLRSAREERHEQATASLLQSKESNRNVSVPEIVVVTGAAQLAERARPSSDDGSRLRL